MTALRVIDPLNDGVSKVQLVDSMGDDVAVVDAARVSFNKESGWVPSALGPALKSSDSRLIHFLARNGHWTPFGHVQLKFRIKAPIFVARQWFKHQIGTVRNEVSRRYVKDTPEFYMPTEMRLKAENVKQGSSDETIDIEQEGQQEFYDTISHEYERMVSVGIAPEQARMILPQSMYTEWIETLSLAAAARIYGLRADSHAQKEIQEYAIALGQLIPELCSESWNALTTPTTET